MQKQYLTKTGLTTMMAVLASVMMSTQALAHPGHDHNAQSAMLVHVLFYGSIVAAIAITVWFVYRNYINQDSK